MIRVLLAAMALLLAVPAAEAAEAAQPVKAPPSVYDRCLAEPAGKTSAGAIACVDAEIRRQDATVERHYQTILKDMIEFEKDRDPPEALGSDPVRAAQRAWIAFRDADCRLPASPTWGARGGLDARKCVLETTVDRVDWLATDAEPSQEPPPGAVIAPPSPCEKKARTDRDISVCAVTGLERSDARLNRVYKALLAQLVPGDQDTLRAAQRLWIAYRDASCNRYLDDRLWGRMAGYQATTCADALTSMRADQLEVFLKAHGLRAAR